VVDKAYLWFFLLFGEEVKVFLACIWSILKTMLKGVFKNEEIELRDNV